jgi:hypothetical protein
MEAPEVFLLADIPWQFFCTLTFVKEDTSMEERRKMFFAWNRRSAEHFGLHFKKLLWALRHERGEITQRLHCHALIGGLRPNACNDRTCFWLEHSWESCTKPLVSRQHPRLKRQEQMSLICGHAKIRVYTPEAAGLAYFAKDLKSQGGFSIGKRQWNSGANQYEAAKFGTAAAVEFSESCSRFIAARQSRGAARPLRVGRG